MAFGKNTPPVANGGNENAPKKADILIRANQNMAVKQEELIRQTKLANSRIDGMLELFQKNMQNTAMLANKTNELFAQLQKENAALKQELLYLAKQSENIYNGLADKITELTNQARNRENAYSGLADKVNDVAEQNKRGERAYAEIVDKITELSEQTKRAEGDYSELLLRLTDVSERTRDAEESYNVLSDKIDDFGEHTKRNEAAYAELSDKMTDVAEQTRRTENTYADLAFKLADINEQSKRTEEAYNGFTVKVNEIAETNRVNESSYVELSDKILALSEQVEKLGDLRYNYQTPVAMPVQTISREEIDYDKLAAKIADLVSVREYISPDLIASKVAEQIIIPQSNLEGLEVGVDEKKIAEAVVEGLSGRRGEDDGRTSGINLNVDLDEEQIARNVLAGINVELDEEKIAKSVLEGLNINLDEENIANKVAENINVALDEESVAERVADLISERGVNVISEVAPADAAVVSSGLDEEDLADRIALKVGSLKAEDFEILVDDEGCDSISQYIAEKLDYQAISDAVAEKLRYALDLADANEPDYEEMAARISEKITVAGINEDAIADKAAAVLSNYLPDFDTDEIADKVMNAVIDVLNAQLSSMTMPAVDNEAISNAITDKIIETQADHDYDIVIDEDGISKITELVSEEIEKDTALRFNQIDGAIQEVKDLLASGVVVAQAAEAAPSYAYDDYPPEEDKLITVSELVKEEPEPEPEPVAPPVVDEKPEKEVDYDDDDDDELMPGEEQDGVDFSNMMKYNRSFIARIIQSTDEQKQYYGAVKQALLSYKKVNSNIAWGAERFNKGRETIARFKIKGKTLCLYLALDPNEYKTSVYHHTDATDNKSMAGTPMMVKIKSALGVKKAIRLIDEMLQARGAEKRFVPERDYAAMYPYETIEELIEDGIVKDVSKKKK